MKFHLGYRIVYRRHYLPHLTTAILVQPNFLFVCVCVLWCSRFCYGHCWAFINFSNGKFIQWASILPLFFLLQASNFFHTCNAIVTSEVTCSLHCIYIWLLFIIYLFVVVVIVVVVRSFLPIVSCIVLKSRPILSFYYFLCAVWFNEFQTEIANKTKIHNNNNDNKRW